MSRSTGKFTVYAAMLVIALVASGCNADWTQFGGGAGNTRNTADAGLAQSTLPTLTQSFTGVTGAAITSSPAVAAGVAYVTSDDGHLYAFSATSTAACSTTTPVTCPPLWTASIQPAGALAGFWLSSSPAVDGNLLYVGAADGSLFAFSATGTTNCSGTPKVCTPVWTATTGGPISSSPTVSGGVVYVGSNDGGLYAFDKAGATNCAASACQPLWAGHTGGAVTGSPAVSGTTVYATSADGKLYGFSTANTTGCSGTPRICTPLWTGDTGSVIQSSPAVRGGSVFVGSTNGVLSVFDAAGSTGCSGAPKACAPLWKATTGGAIYASPAVTSSVVYVGSSDQTLYAIDSTGTTNCSGSPKVCTPLWTATTGGAIHSSPVVAGATVAVGSDDHNLYAFDAAGAASCSGSPKVCTPLWSAATGAGITSSPAVAQGMVYAASLDHSLYAYKPWVFTRPTCPANPHAGLSPCNLQDAYRLPSQVAGTGRTVAIVDAYDNPNAEADLAVYRAAYGLPPCTTANGCFKKLNQNGVAGSYPAGDRGWAMEIALDLDAVSATCPLCHITLVEANSSLLTDMVIAEDTAAVQNPVAVSNSYGASEFSGQTTLDGHFNHPGIMITASSGDAGYGTEWPAAIPGVTAVGGTELTADASARGWTETVWSGAGSGCSSQEPKPAWQTDTGCANRTIADVAALAGSPGLAIYHTYRGSSGWLVVGGTSLASPIIASVYALAYPARSIVSTYANAASLSDITAGSNGSCSGSYLCTGATGYDGPTGLGTPCGTLAFGTGPFVSGSCPAPSPGASPGAPAVPASDVLTPVCGPVPPGYARCLAREITISGN